jgi:hypothetical protein
VIIQAAGQVMPEREPTLEEWIAATQSCCGADWDNDDEKKSDDVQIEDEMPNSQRVDTTSCDHQPATDLAE